ncbi:MAG: glycerate kinase [Clostridiales bacterium]|nr:glycerate kinase [Clostridiales bacterium]
MKILIGPDSLKDSVSASQVCHIATELIATYWPEDELITVPLADGGEGTVEALVEGAQGRFISLEVTGPLGNAVHARYGLIYNDEVAVIEMAEASGLPLVSKHLRNPMKTTTYGTGELILDAIDKGCKKIIIGIGGSATNDAGIGMMQALGYKCLDKNDNEVPYGGDGLLKLHKILPPTKDRSALYKAVTFQVACDVKNPLYGENGAAYVYSAQKGADSQMIKHLDQGLMNFSECVKRSFDIDISTLSGGGAAGGLGASLFASLDGELLPGFEIINQLLGLEDHLKKDLDLVITSEGQLNHQSFNGKLPIELAKLAKTYNTPTIVLVGSTELSLDDLKETGIIGVFPILSGPMTLSESMANGDQLIRQTLHNILSLLHNINHKKQS